MKLEKAIETIISIKHVCRGLLPPKEQEALSMGIEGLKREQLLRHEIPYDRGGLLPGETEE